MYSRSTKTLFATPSCSEDFWACVGYCTPCPMDFLSAWFECFDNEGPIDAGPNRLACVWKGARHGGVVIWATNRFPHYIFAHLWHNKDHGIWTPNVYCTCTLLDLHHAACYMSNLYTMFFWLKLAVMAFFLAGLARSRALHLARARCWGPTARCFSSALPEPLKQRGVEELRFWICIVVFNDFFVWLPELNLYSSL